MILSFEYLGSVRLNNALFFSRNPFSTLSNWAQQSRRLFKIALHLLFEWPADRIAMGDAVEDRVIIQNDCKKWTLSMIWISCLIPKALVLEIRFNNALFFSRNPFSTLTVDRLTWTSSPKSFNIFLKPLILPAHTYSKTSMCMNMSKSWKRKSLTLMRSSLAWGGATSISSITRGLLGSQATAALHLMT